MSTALSLHLPTWPADLLRRRDRRRPFARPDPSPILIAAVSGQRRVVAHRCERAAAAGVLPGMDVAHARAMLPSRVRLVVHRPGRDLAALRALAVWAVRFAPVVAPDPPDGLLMDISGCERLYGSTGALADAVAEAVRRLGLRARVAAAPTIGCAWAVARFGARDRAVVPPGRIREALADLPLRALRISEEAAHALREVGLTRIGHLLSLPRSSLPARFGPELLLRLDQAMGHAMEVIAPVRPSEPARAERVFDGPTTRLEAVMMASRELVDRLCALLAERESGATRADLDLCRADLGPLRLTAMLSRPSRSPRHLWALLGPQVERAHLGFGVDRIVLTAALAGRIPHEQAEHWPTQPHDPRRLGPELGELIDAAVNRFGPDRVLRAEPVATHIPEQAVRWWPITEAPRREASDAAITGADRPSLLFPQPEPAEAIALAPDSPPSRLRWRGREHAIAAGIGPERIGPAWWSGPTPTRDYFKVQDDAGLWLWVYRERPGGRWFVHGLWT